MTNSSTFLSLTLNYSTSVPPTDSQPKSTQTAEVLELPHVVVLCTVLSVASVLGTLGTSLVLLSIVKFDNLREIPDLFIFSLSLSDFIVTALYQPLRAYRFAHFQQELTNMVLVTLSRLLGYLSLIASITNMFGVTVERLISIRFPLKYELVMTRRRAITALIFIWILSFTLVIMVSVKVLSLSALALYLLMALIGTVSIYVYIFLIAKRLEDSAQNQVQNNSVEDGRANSKRERKAAKTITIILGVASGCWLPFLIVPYITSEEPDYNRYWTVFYSLQVLSMCNSSINPYIYCARSRRYFNAFVKLLGLQRFFQLHRAVAPASTARNVAVNIHAVADAPRDIETTQVEAKGEINDVAL